LKVPNVDAISFLSSWLGFRKGALAGCGSFRSQGVKNPGEPNSSSTATLATSAAPREVNQSYRALYGEHGIQVYQQGLLYDRLDRALRLNQALVEALCSFAGGRQADAEKDSELPRRLPKRPTWDKSGGLNICTRHFYNRRQMVRTRTDERLKLSAAVHGGSTSIESVILNNCTASERQRLFRSIKDFNPSVRLARNLRRKENSDRNREARKKGDNPIED